MKTRSSDNMTLLPAILAAALTLGACSDHDNADAPHPNDILAASHARQDAQRAIEAPEGSMAREGAILHIRATQEAILSAGDTAAAIVYTDTATALLRQAHLIY